MSIAILKPRRIEIETGSSVSALAQAPSNAKACLVLAHGAGAGMDHPFMRTVADGLADRHIATLRYQFPFMESGSKRPDRPLVAQAAVRAAVLAAREAFPGLPLFAGGKSFGGRMTSQAQAIAPMPDVRGLVFLGFPLHAAGQPSSERAKHLTGIKIPMLFLQGTRDQLAEIDRIQALMVTLDTMARLEVVEHADHSFHVLVRSGRNDNDVMQQLLDSIAGFVTGIRLLQG